MVGWDYKLNGHEFEEALGDGERQGNQACCGPWGLKESDTTERLNNNSIYEFQFLHILINSCYFSIFFLLVAILMGVKWPNLVLICHLSNVYVALAS